MINIVKEGTKKLCTCNMCGCLFSYEDEDISKNLIVTRIGQHEEEVIKCPQCRANIVLKATR